MRGKIGGGAGRGAVSYTQPSWWRGGSSIGTNSEDNLNVVGSHIAVVEDMAEDVWSIMRERWKS